MPNEVRQGALREFSGALAQASPTWRRLDGLPRARGFGPLPIEIAFLAAQGLRPGLLLKAAAEARAIDVTADRALLGAGFPEDTFYRLLARHLGMPYLEQPMRLVLPPHPLPLGREIGAASLAQNARGLDRVLAPRGAALRELLDLFQAGEGRGTRTAIVSPRCLKALIRRQTRPALLHLAGHGLGSWNQALSAEGGPTTGQSIAASATVFAILAGLVGTPHATVSALMIVVWGIVFSSVALRLTAAASSPRPARLPEARLPDPILPIYTIVVPLLREAKVVPQLVRSMDRLDYPALCRKRNKHHRLQHIYHLT